MSTKQKSIEVLNQEAQEALDRLADKREELAQEHKATELAADRQREREQERLREERREAEEREQERLGIHAVELGEKRLALEIRAEEEASALAVTIEELLVLDPDHARAVQAAHGKTPEQRYSQAFSRVLGGWFREKFREVVPGIGFNYWEGNPPLHSETR